MQINAKTPTPDLLVQNKDGSTLEPPSPLKDPKQEAGNPAAVPKDSSIKDLLTSPRVIGELDVETNYLRQSGQNFSEEMHLKTVF